MKPKHTIPSIIIALSLAASIVDVVAGDVRHAIYYMAAAVMTASATF